MLKMFAMLALFAIIVSAAGINSHLITAKVPRIIIAAYASSDKEDPTKQDKHCFTAAKQHDVGKTDMLNCYPTNKDCEDNREPLLDIESLEISRCREYPNNNYQ